MLTDLAAFMIGLWQAWSAVFSGIPYGNPFLAICSPLLVLAAAIYGLVAYRRRAALMRACGDQYARLELFKKVMNYR
ncbi:MAG: hypothetical protein HQ483_02670 [Rhodospirillales bacterium]|nr:hypothetical protein [Rhodospirillales bacterium]